jgi:hypothetical protein
MERREFLRLSSSLAAAVALAPWTAFAESGAAGAANKPAGSSESDSTRDSASESALDPKVVKELEKSPFVYISPLKSNGEESRCHAEVWYAWLDEAVVVTVAANRWKAKALAKGLDSAKIWVGDHGRTKTLGISNDGYLEGQSFVARASESSDADLMKRLITAYQTKYPDEIGNWADKMQSGFEDGSRTLIRYVPAG